MNQFEVKSKLTNIQHRIFEKKIVSKADKVLLSKVNPTVLYPLFTVWDTELKAVLNSLIK